MNIATFSQRQIPLPLIVAELVKGLEEDLKKAAHV